MRTRLFLISVALALSSVFLPACAKDNPQTKYGTALDAYVVEEQTVINLRQAGSINDAEYSTVLALLHTERQALRDWKSALSEGRDPSASAIALTAARGAIEAYITSHSVVPHSSTTAH